MLFRFIFFFLLEVFFIFFFILLTSLEKNENVVVWLSFLSGKHEKDLSKYDHPILVRK